MAFSLLVALVVLMATGSGSSCGSGKKKSSKRSRTEVSTSSESGHSSENEGESVIGKGKAPMPSRKQKDREYSPHSFTGEQPITSQRRGFFQNRACIGERHVNFDELCRQVPKFERLVERIPIRALGRVPANKGFCSELIREFYMRGVRIEEDCDPETYKFETSVQGVKFDITPEVIGANLGLHIDTSGLDYTQGDFESDTHWDVIVNAICKTGTHTNGEYVVSKDLKPEYHILSLILCYNLLPTVGTKRIRWHRLLLLYFLGHPESATGLCVNIPYLIWEHMAYVIKATNSREFLPFPIFITSLLEDHGVDVTCDKYDYGLGAIDRITLAKSIGTLRAFGQVKGRASDATPSAAPRQVQHEATTGSDEGVSVQSLQRDLNAFKKIVEQGFKKIEDGLKKIIDILGCKHDDVVPGAIGTSTSHGATSHDDDVEERHDDD